LPTLFHQTTPPLEVIIVDDGSKDNTWEILTEFAQKNPLLKIHRSAKNEGVTAAIATAVQMAKGDFIYLFATDDFLAPQCVEWVTKGLKMFPQTPLAIGQADIFQMSEGGSKVIAKIRHEDLGAGQEIRYFSPEQLRTFSMRKSNWGFTGPYFFQRSKIIKLLPRSLDFDHSSDCFLAHVCGLSGGAVYIPEVLTRYRDTRTSVSATSRNTPESIIKIRKAWWKVLTGDFKNLLPFEYVRHQHLELADKGMYQNLANIKTSQGMLLSEMLNGENKRDKLLLFILRFLLKAYISSSRLAIKLSRRMPGCKG